ncbi:MULTISPECIES: enoyl-CoA hydratase/isomerase family protein [Methylobacterium]|uniref:3-hydroxyisobutyryl-CoA hydrolase n=3 Tax=Pseudomonadota TaxID=1224 RepID=A0ABQ4SX51_9HYPH|nr:MULTISPECIES: enoyl-CoA hydratase/isomerase family protein [Methylobacterium]PIU08081.1 MAG: 3-hydroxyisobutyryl-CoA hydrolase [Methylobacterium sp. CG09_land_8_20_14_0_10_71_15]PIU15536.1 MAG: 3-hydroxyisobutyryl-CoA hydrolase [Methylobacterium sp. CG08_land_8_20_14_0_20_71_15]GBU19453.1 3-hydroxyisobutyryl-CoA hydrolase [Methylobacterium sp.]GJE07677.1 Fatty acid oxidation complex subunit alpha [Methylobacterium jeotgali]
MDATGEEIRFERRGALGLVVLDRPKALNALSRGMCASFRRQLDLWEADPAVTRVAVRSSSARAFCAGGDIRHIYACGREGREADLYGFWEAEYGLVARVQRFAKPYVALVDGLVMGGGVGISLHGSHRVASERYSFAMPEVGIGLFPDVGMTHALPRLPGRMGLYIALTGGRVGPGDALALGLATDFAPAAAFDALLDRLAEGGPVEAALAVPGERPAPGPLSAQAAPIEACFSAGSVAAILERLDAAGTAFARETAATIRTRSPTSLCIAFEQMRRGGAMSFPEAILAEFRLVTRVMDGHDFYEGVRAAVIDKDNAPVWQPDRLDGVDLAAVAAAFGPASRPEPRFA